MMLKIINLTKKFGKFTALDKLNLEIGKGELFGFVGPNGAGKTTTMKIVSGLLRVDSGEVFVNDIDALHNNKALKSKIGYMPDFFGVYDNLKVSEYMEFYASIYGITGNKSKKLCNELMNLVTLEDKKDCYVDTLSRGMKQKLCLARSLVHEPELLILDEPGAGLDPRARYEMKEILKNLKERGKTILISSHILPELVEMCSSIGVIEKGKMVVKGTVDDIMKTLNTSSPLVIKIVEEQGKAIQLLKENPLVENISIKEGSISIRFSGDSMEEALLLENFIENKVKISSFSREGGNLESLFMQLTAKKDGKAGL